jgi:hypothetical protein
LANINWGKNFVECRRQIFPFFEQLCGAAATAGQQVI